MYQRLPTQEELDAHGLSLEDYEDDDPVYIWPENSRAFHFFRRLGTRWRIGGLRWEAVYPLMDRLGLAPDEWDALLEDLEVLEGAALKEMERQQKK
nr:DUF1799 domain-containing protein [Paracidovorax wautersii]